VGAAPNAENRNFGHQIRVLAKNKKKKKKRHVPQRKEMFPPPPGLTAPPRDLKINSKLKLKYLEYFFFKK